MSDWCVPSMSGHRVTHRVPSLQSGLVLGVPVTAGITVLLISLVPMSLHNSLFLVLAKG